jgi:hypothetical protein
LSNYISAEAETWQNITSKHFVVMFTHKDKKIAKSTIRIAERFIPEITSSIGYTLDKPVYIIIAPSKEIFERLSGRVEKWVIGRAWSKYNKIVILSPRKIIGNKSEIERIIRHEYTHILLGHATKGNFMPKWLSEGLAMYHETKTWRIADNIQLAEAVLTRSVLPFHSLNIHFPADKRKAALAYAQSLDMVTYIIKEYGQDSIKQLITELSKGYEFNIALLNSINTNMQTLEIAWLTWLNDRYKWFFIITNTSLLWLLLPIICIIAYIRKYIQSKRKKAQWDMEDGIWHPSELNYPNYPDDIPTR